MGKKALKEQISLWDIELPPQKEAEKVVASATDTEEKKEGKSVNFARVQDTSPRHLFKSVPAVNDILKMLDRAAYRVSRAEILSDIFQCGAIAISNKFDMIHAEEREKEYLRIIKKYDKDMQNLICEIFANIYILLQSQIDYGFDDYLGKLYMLSETNSKNAGQFFTPYCVSKVCAEVAISESKVNECIEQDRILTLNEPACGSGGMVLAAVDVLYNKYKFNYSRNLVVECSDIDSRCVYMAYLQLGLAGVPAVIYQRDTISMKTWQRWETPAYIMQWLRFKNVLE